MTNGFCFQDETIYIFQVDDHCVSHYIVHPSGSQVYKSIKFDHPVPLNSLKELLNKSGLPNIRTQRMTHHYVDRDVIIRTMLFEFVLIDTRKSSKFIDSYEDLKSCGKIINGVYHYQEWPE